MWLENYAGYRAEIAYTTHLNGSNIYINNTYNSGNILFSINSSEKARILNTGQFKLNGYTSTSSFTGTAAGYLAFDSSGNILTTAAPSGGISGSGTTNYVPKFTGSSAIGNSLIFDNGTNVGIGTTSPSKKLHVYGTNDNVALFDNDGSQYTTIYLANNGVTKALLAWDNTAGNYQLGTSVSAYMSFLTSNAERMRITSGGNVGIGTTSPGVKLDVIGALNVTSDSTEQIVIKTLTNTNRQLLIGYNYTPNYSYIQSVHQGVSYTNLLLQPNGGNVGIGCTPNYGKVEIQGATTDKRLYIGTNIYYSNSIDILGLSSIGGEIPLGIAGSQIQYYTAATERMRITSAGNVGIGTTSPSSKFHVWNGGIKTTGFPSAGNPFNFLESNYNDSAVTVRFQNINPTNGYDADLGIQLMNTSASIVDVLRIKGSTGNVGIGTTSPSNKLTVESDDAFNQDTSGQIVIKGSTTTTKNLRIGFDTGNNYGYVQAINTGISTQPFVMQPFGGNVGIGTTSPYAKLMLSVAASASDVHALEITNNTDASFAVYLRNNITTLSAGGAGNMVFSNSSERVRIASDGRFQVNNTGYSANCTATLRALTGTSTDKILECMTISYSSAFYVRNDGNYYFSGSNLSDARTKKDISYLEESILDKVMKLKPASFRYKENEENIKGGFIAQDIKEIFPDLVTATKSDDEMMGVDYYGVIAILTKAIQELKLEVEELKNK
jgi:hypothetical protein